MFSEEISWLVKALNFGDICLMRIQIQTLQCWRCIVLFLKGMWWVARRMPLTIEELLDCNVF